MLKNNPFEAIGKLQAHFEIDKFQSYFPTNAIFRFTAFYLKTAVMRNFPEFKIHFDRLIKSQSCLAGFRKYLWRITESGEMKNCIRILREFLFHLWWAATKTSWTQPCEINLGKVTVEISIFLLIDRIFIDFKLIHVLQSKKFQGLIFSPIFRFNQRPF